MHAQAVDAQFPDGPGRRGVAERVVDTAPWWVFVAAMLVWIAAGSLLPNAVASPIAAWDALAEGFGEGWMWSPFEATMRATAIGSMIAVATGLTTGVLAGLSRFWGDVLEPMFLAVYSMPKIIFYPVVMLVFGIGVQSTTAFGVANGVLPVVIITFAAVRTVPLIYLKVGRVYGLGRLEVFRSIVIPVVLPSVITAVRYGFSLTFLGVILAEMFAAREGMGRELFKAISLHHLGRLFAFALLLLAIALVVNTLLLLLEKRIQRRASGARRKGMALASASA